MISVGETLRRERLRRNLDLDQISHELKISAKFLDAIENEQFDRLPARIFAKSFVRQYAQLLDLDEDELSDEVQRQLQPPPANPQTGSRPSAPAPAEIQLPPVERWDGGMATRDRFSWSSTLPALAMFVVILLVCSGVYSWWQRTKHPVSAQNAAPVTQSEPAAQPPAVETPATPAPTQTAQQNPAAAETPTHPPASQPSATEPAPALSADRVSGERPSTAPPAAPPTVATPGVPGGAQPAIVRATTDPNPKVRLEVTAVEPVWVLAQNNGKYLFSGTLEANQTRTIEADGTVTLRLGNAGGVTILLNGNAVGTVGPKGQVRTVQFTSGGFHIVPAPKPSVPLDDML